MTPTKEQIREQYLANQLFLIGEKLGPDLEVIDRRANYIVVVNGSGETSKMFLDEAFSIKMDPLKAFGGGFAAHNATEQARASSMTVSQLEDELHKVYHEHPEYHDDGYHSMVDKFAGDNFYKLHHVAKEYLKAPEEYRMSPADIKLKQQGVTEGRRAIRFSSFIAKAEPAAFSYKGYKPRNFQNHPDAQAVFESLTKAPADPYAVLSALKHVDIFFEKRDEHSLEIARKAVAKIDSLENHSYLVESQKQDDLCWKDEDGKYCDVVRNEPTGKWSVMHDSKRLPVDHFDDREEAKNWLNDWIAKGKPSLQEDTIKDEEIDFQIEEKLTYSALTSFLTESFEKHVQEVADHLEKHPQELDKLADHVKTIAHIAHHYDHHSVHMKESVEDKDCPTCKGTGEVPTGIGMMPCEDCHPAECKHCNSTGVVDTGIGELPCPECHGARAVNESLKQLPAPDDHGFSRIVDDPDSHHVSSVYVSSYKQPAGKYRVFGMSNRHGPYPLRVVDRDGLSEDEVHKLIGSRLAKAGIKHQKANGGEKTFCASNICLHTGTDHTQAHEIVESKEIFENVENKAIEHAEGGQRIGVRHLSTGPQLVKIAKRAAVELIAQRLANKPVKKISEKEKNEIVKVIKQKKTLVMKLTRKLIPKIKRIEHENHEHSDEFGSAE
jgi:hypothetical protein